MYIQTPKQNNPPQNPDNPLLTYNPFGNVLTGGLSSFGYSMGTQLAGGQSVGQSLGADIADSPFTQSLVSVSEAGKSINNIADTIQSQKFWINAGSILAGSVLSFIALKSML